MQMVMLPSAAFDAALRAEELEERIEFCAVPLGQGEGWTGSASVTIDCDGVQLTELDCEIQAQFELSWEPEPEGGREAYEEEHQFS